MKLLNRKKLRILLSLIFLGLLLFIIGEATRDRHANIFALIMGLLLSAGIFYLSRDFLLDIKDKYGEYALKTSKEFIQKINSLFMLIYGLYIIASVFAFDYFEDYFTYKKTVLAGTMLFLACYLLIGYSFIILSKLSLDKQEKSLKLQLVITIFSFIYLVIMGENLMSVLPILLFICISYYTKDLLYKKRFIYSWEEKSLDIFVSSLVYFFYAININKRRSFPAYTIGLRLIFLICAVVLLILASKLIFSYMKNGEGLENFSNLSDLDDLLVKYSSKQSNAAALAYLRDKYIYYYKNKDGENTVAFQYGLINNKAIVMGEPFGNEEDIADALYSFNNDCLKSGLRPIFYEVGEKFTLNLHDYGYDFMKFGENALVDLEKFSLAGRKKSTERNILNRFKKDGYEFKIVRPPYLDDFLDKLEEISNSWLDGREEKGFSLGFFDRDYLRKSEIAIVVDSKGEITAFTNIMPDKNSEVLSIDLMRYDMDKNVNSMMDFLFLNLFIHGQENSYKYFNLGMAPLSNVGIIKSAYLTERMAYLVYKHGNKFYSFKGLRNYKQKYASDWIPKYMAYAKGNWLLYSLIALSLIDRKNSKNR